MTLIEIGSLAGAMVAVITLITKLVSLITAIHNLIGRLDSMAIDIEEGDKQRQLLALNINQQEEKLFEIENLFVEIRQEISEIKRTVKEMLQRVY